MVRRTRLVEQTPCWKFGSQAGTLERRFFSAKLRHEDLLALFCLAVVPSSVDRCQGLRSSSSEWMLARYDNDMVHLLRRQ